MTGKKLLTNSVSDVSDKRIGRSYRSSLLRNKIFVGGVAALALSPFLASKANAQTVQLGDFTVTLQSTLGYTVGERTSPINNRYLNTFNPATEAVNGLNSDDGDRNFKSGIMTNRFQTLEQLTVKDGDYGLRASAIAYIDTVYLQDSKNTSPNTFNSYGIGPRGFTSGTVANEGRRIEPLALFLYGAEYFNNGNDKLSWQIGRQTITWGEDLFTVSGIAGLQAPLDAYQGQVLPDPQAQALFLPTGAAQITYSLANSLEFDAYWQFEYEPDILQGVGSYFSQSDIIGPGAQRILGSQINQGAYSIYRAPDIRPKNGLDQFGFSAHYTVNNNYGLGAYFVRGIPKAPAIYTNVGGFAAGPAGPKIGVYNIVYPQPVDAFAASVTTLVGAANVAGEVDDFLNAPLVSEPAYTSANPAKYSDPLYAEGNVFNGAVNAIWLTPPVMGPIFSNGLTVSGELTFNDVIAVNKNKPALVPYQTSDGAGLNLSVTPNWYPRADLEIETPVSWATTYVGKSEYSGVDAGTSTYDIGIKAVYRNNLTVGLNYQRYAGPPNRQAYLDRDFATFYIQDTF